MRNCLGMTTEERLAIIRDRARQKPVLYPVVTKRERYWVPVGTGRVKPPDFMGEVQPTRLGPASEWIREPIAQKPPEKGLRMPDRKGAHYLTKIAEQLPRKLPVLTFCPETRRRP